MHFVPLDASHIPAIVEIEREHQGSPWSNRSFENELVNPHAIFLVGIEKGEILAYGGIWMVVDEAHITNVMVVPEARRRGIGRNLMLHLLNAGKEKGMSCSTLEVRVSNHGAIALYKALGYIEVAVRKAYYPNNQEDAVIMWLYDLSGVPKPQ